jgi:ferrochelatase
MRYWYPYTHDALEDIRRDKIEALVIIPLYPQFSISTSGSSLRVLQEEFSKDAGASQYTNLVHTVVPSWYHRPGYINAMAQLLTTELNSFTNDQIQQAKLAAPHMKALHVLFSAHGVPQSYIEAGDPYQQQIVECVRMIADKLPTATVDVHLSYQSRVGPIEWLRPYTDDVLPELAEKGVRNLVVVPISFVSEHIETLEEIDMEYRELAEASGITNWRRCPALNTDPAFIEDMADMVMEALAEPVQTVTEVCVAHMNDVEALDYRADIKTVGIQGVRSGGDSNLVNIQKEGWKAKELLNARVAMVGVALTLLIELLNGKSLIHMFGN